MNSTDVARLAQIRRDYGALSEDAHGHAGALAFVLRLLGETESQRVFLAKELSEANTYWENLLSEQERATAKARQQAIEECAKFVEMEKMSIAHGEWLWKTHSPRMIRALAKPEKEPTT